MIYRRAAQVALLVEAYALLCPPVTCAQLPRKIEWCLPYPTLANEIRDMVEETTPHPKVIIDAVKIEGTARLAQSIQERLITAPGAQELEADSNWIEWVQEVATEVCREQGYFYAKVTAKAQPVSGDSTRQQISVIVQVDERLQYRLADVRFAGTGGSLAFPPEELRKRIPLRRGEVFNPRKITEGMEALRKLYASHGYIDVTITPDLKADNVHQSISVLMEINKGRQFRVGKVEILGLDRRMESVLRSKLKPGNVFNPWLVDDFLNENRSLLPPDASGEDLHVYQDLRSGTVTLKFDFRTCPQLEN